MGHGPPVGDVRIARKHQAHLWVADPSCYSLQPGPPVCCSCRGVRLGGDLGPGNLDALRHALTIGFANKLARRLPHHNAYRALNASGQLAQLHPSCAELAEDADGLPPEWLVFHELVATSRPFLRQVSWWPCRALSYARLVLQCSWIKTAWGTEWHACPDALFVTG